MTQPAPPKHRKQSSRRRSGSSDPRHRREEGAYTVAIRNESLSLVYRRLALAAMVSLLAAAVSVVAFLGVSGKKVPPQYIPVTEDGRLLPLIPLSKPNVDDSVIGQFALGVAREANNYDYLNWRAQITRAQPYFIPTAWKHYLEEFDRTKITNTVEARKMIVVAHPSGHVEIENRGLGDNGAYRWRVAVPLDIQYVSHAEVAGQANVNLSSHGRITLYIERVPPTLSPRGIAVAAYQYDQQPSR